MFVTRRFLLRSIAALPAAYYLGATAPLWAAPHDCNSTTSVFVILEGPWLIWQDETDTSHIKALTFGDQSHMCSVSQQTCGGTPSNLGQLDAYARATVDITGSSSNSFQSILQASSHANAKSTDPGDDFVWITGQGKPSIQTQPWDRIITLTAPTAVHTAGFLKYATVASSSSSVLAHENVHSHIATILEYAPVEGQTVQLSLGGMTHRRHAKVHATPIVGGQHVVFRMVHTTECDQSMELCHIQCAFMGLAERVSISGKSNLVAMSIKNDSSYNSGADVNGFGDDELGLHPPKKPLCSTVTSRVNHNDTYANCAGGGIMVGP